jgi:hypothetical protein
VGRGPPEHRGYYSKWSANMTNIDFRYIYIYIERERERESIGYKKWKNRKWLRTLNDEMDGHK